MLKASLIAAAIAICGATSAARAGENEISLLNGQGEATAYIAISDELTIYLWDGTPVAYLKQDQQGGFHVYGFNGQHMGWLVNDIIFDGQGRAACATKDRLQMTQLEPLKSLKQLKPLKSLTALPPLRPIFYKSWGESCQLLLAEGSQ